MEQIISKNNSAIKKLIKLKQKKYRDEFNLALIEGEKNVLEAYNSKALETIVFTDKYFKKDLSCLKDSNIKKLYVDNAIFNLISVETTPQQILGVIKVKTQNINLHPKGNFLILDNIQNPGNLGAILRSALASNFLNIYMLNCVDVFNAKVINASAGNIFKLNLYNITLDNLITISQNKNIELCATVMNGENIFNYKANKNKIYGIIMGNEGNGVTNDVLQLATKKLTIPMHNGVESLNVAVAASLIMYYIEGVNNERT